MASLFDELRKRHVIRVAGMYAVAGWLIIEVGMALETTLNLPSWFDTMVTVLVLIGFPIALILAWAFDITPQGIQRTPSSQTAAGEPPRSGRTIDILIIAGLAVIAGIATWQAVKSPGQETTTATATIATPVSEEDQSIAVLPFEALSTNQDDAFFGKGISEELLNSLAKFPGLKVAARTSAFSFAGQNIDLREVGEKLGVAHVLEGSVRRSGEQLRITAQLIRAKDGFHLWSETYDRKMTDVFEIQDEIVGELSAVLQFRLGVGAGAGRATESRANAQAYEMYLKGLDMWWQRESLENRAGAVTAFLRTTELDPEFADGWAAYANSVALSSPIAWPHLTTDTVVPAINAAYGKALALEPDNIRALAGLGYWYSGRDINIDKARQSIDAARRLSPNDAFVQYSLAQFASMTGDDTTRAAAMQRTLADDPLNDTKRRVDFVFRSASGDFDPNSAFVAPILQQLEACSATRTCGEDILATALNGLLIPAVQSRSESDIRHISALVTDATDATDTDNLTLTDEIAAEVRCYHSLVMQVHEKADPSDELMQCASKAVGDADSEFLAVSIVAHAGLVDEAVELMFEQERQNYGLSSASMIYALSDGPFEMPESVRRHPRYHEWWGLDGFREIAAARRANGSNYGLPLPTDGSAKDSSP